MIKELKNIINNLEGNLLGIGVEDDKIITLISNNDKITEVDLLSKTSGKKLKGFGSKTKKINIKKLKKRYKKKSIDNMIIEASSVYKYLKNIVKDTIYLNNNKLIIYGNIIDTDLDLFLERYNRYNVKIEKIIKDKNYILIIDNKNSKNFFFKDKWYFIKDCLYVIIDMIGEILSS